MNLRNLDKASSLKLKQDSLNQQSLRNLVLRDQGSLEYPQWRKLRLRQDKKNHLLLHLTPPLSIQMHAFLFRQVNQLLSK